MKGWPAAAAAAAATGLSVNVAVPIERGQTLNVPQSPGGEIGSKEDSHCHPYLYLLLPA